MVDLLLFFSPFPPASDCDIIGSAEHGKSTTPIKKKKENEDAA